MKRKTPWLKHCKKCGKFVGKNGRHQKGVCQKSGGQDINFVSPVIDWKKFFHEYKESWDAPKESWDSPVDMLGIPIEPNPYLTIAKEIAELVIEKQAAYGDSFGKAGGIMRILYPDGIKPEQLDDALTITRIIDKLFRIATKKDAFGENPWKDIMGYALLATVKGK